MSVSHEEVSYRYIEVKHLTEELQLNAPKIYIYMDVENGDSKFYMLKLEAGSSIS